MFSVCPIWCSRRDLNPYGFPPEPKSGASANFATAAYKFCLSIISYRRNK